jgi:hypothetical protein
MIVTLQRSSPIDLQWIAMSWLFITGLLLPFKYVDFLEWRVAEYVREFL